jgi:hypothetical protein
MLLSKSVSAVGSGIRDGIVEIALIPSDQTNIVQNAEIVGLYHGREFVFLVNP